MRHYLLSYALIMALQLTVLSHWLSAEDVSWFSKHGETIEENAYTRSKSGFAAKLILSSDLNLYDEWGNGDMESVDAVERIDYSTVVIPVVLFINPMKNEFGDVNVSYDLEVFSPAGHRTQHVRNMSCATGTFAASKFDIQLAERGIKWMPDVGDPAGKWMFRVIVKDHYADLDLNLERSLVLSLE